MLLFFYFIRHNYLLSIKLTVLMVLTADYLIHLFDLLAFDNLKTFEAIPWALAIAPRNSWIRFHFGNYRSATKHQTFHYQDNWIIFIDSVDSFKSQLNTEEIIYWAFPNT